MSYTSIDDLQLTDYSEKSVVVTGNTREYKEDLKAYGGKWNGRLRNGPGWIFPKHKRGILEKWIETGQRIVEDTRSKVSVETSQVTRGPAGDLELVRRMDKIESKLDMIIEMMSQNMKIDMKSMSEEVKNISRELDIESDGSSDIVYEEEEEIVMKRLLR